MWQSECPDSPAAQMLVSEEKLRAVFELMDQNQDALVTHPVCVGFVWSGASHNRMSDTAMA